MRLSGAANPIRRHLPTADAIEKRRITNSEGDFKADGRCFSVSLLHVTIAAQKDEHADQSLRRGGS